MDFGYKSIRIYLHTQQQHQQQQQQQKKKKKKRGETFKIIKLGHIIHA